MYTSDTYTWSQDPAGNPYISAKTSVTDPGTGNQQSALSTQTLDQYGNVLQSVIYPYNNTTTTPLRTYNNTYLSDSNHTSNYVMNALQTSTLTFGTTTKTLVQNYFISSPPCSTSAHERNGPESPGAASVPRDPVLDNNAGEEDLFLHSLRVGRAAALSATPKATAQPSAPLPPPILQRRIRSRPRATATASRTTPGSA